MAEASDRLTKPSQRAHPHFPTERFVVDKATVTCERDNHQDSRGNNGPAKMKSKHSSRRHKYISSEYLAKAMKG